MDKRILATGLAILLAASTLTPGPASAEGRNVEIHGFLLGDYTGRVSGLRPMNGEAGDFPLGEERARIEVTGWSESIRAEAKVKVDIYHDAIDNEFGVDLREGFIDYTAGPFDFRIGRQIITWGVGDLIFINDAWPKDWVSFFTGRPLEYLKVGVDGFRVRYSSKAINAEVIAVPFYTPDNMPTPDRFFYYDPFAMITNRVEKLPDNTYENTELAMRVYGRLLGVDLSLYVYKGYWRSPSVTADDFMAPTELTLFYPDLAIFGLSATRSLLGGVLSLEGGYYYSSDDIHGDDPLIPNSQIRFLAGFQRQLWKDFTAGAQYYGEIMQEYSNYRDTLPMGFPAKEEYRDVATIRLEQLLKNQTIKLGLFAFYSPADNDFLIQPQGSYKFSDNLAATLGANIFGGENEYTFLGQFDKNDNVYLSVKFDF